MRNQELCALEWRHIRLEPTSSDAGEIRIEQSCEMLGNKYVITPYTKTVASRRVIPISDDVADILRAQYQLTQLEALRKKYTGNQLVFPSKKGTVLSLRNIQRTLVAVSGHAQIKPIRPHDTRHTYASSMIAARYDVVTLSRRMGHSSPHITLKTYAQFFERANQAATPSLNDLLG